MVVVHNKDIKECKTCGRTDSHREISIPEESMKLDAIFNQARSFDIAQRNSENFNLSQVTTGFEDNSSLNATNDLPHVGRSSEQEKRKKFVIALLQLKAVNMTIQLVLICRRSAAVVVLGSNIQLQNALPREVSVLSVPTLGTTPKSAVPVVKPLIILH